MSKSKQITIRILHKELNPTILNVSTPIPALFNWTKQGDARLIKLTFENQSLINLATYLKRYTTGSSATLYQYVFGVHRFTEWITQTPDQLIQQCKTPEGRVNNDQVERIQRLIGDFVGDLQAEGLAPETINNHVKGVKALFLRNGITLQLPKLRRQIKYRDRSPRPDELQHLIEIADIRGKTIISLLALTGIRVGTLVKLQYRHVKHDLERNNTPIHLHIEADITKGEYGDYDTFIGAEGSEYLKAYLELRKSEIRRKPGEVLKPESPLISDARSHKSKPITPSQVHRIINTLYKQAGLITKTSKPRYQLRAHSLRKYFKTQLTSLGTIQTDYIEYMMGHTISTYNDIEMKGIEFFRNLYASSGLSIKPKTQVNKFEMLKALAETLGLDPNVVLSREAITKPHRTIVDGSTRETQQETALAHAIKQALLKEINPKNSIKSYHWEGSPEEIRTLVRGSRGPYP